MTDLPSVMRGVWLTSHGDMDKLTIRHDIPVPVPGPRDGSCYFREQPGIPRPLER